MKDFKYGVDRKKLPEILEEFQPKDIFNADESGLFMRALPDRRLVNSSEKAVGGKVPKERISILLCANMSGCEKKKLLVIGRSKKPRCFPRDLQTLPVDYDYSSKAWMTGIIFTRWLHNWDRELRLQKRKIILLIDNCSAHPQNVELTNIVIEFLPKNTTSIIQPLDAGIIRNFKHFYKISLRRKILLLADSNLKEDAKSLMKKIDVLTAIHLSAQAWRNVTSETIENCFKFAFSVEKNQNSNSTPLEELDLPEGLDIASMNAQIDEENQFDEFLANSEFEFEAEEEVEEDATDVSEPPEISTSECIKSLSIVQSYFQSIGGNEHLFSAFLDVEKSLLLKKTEESVFFRF